MSPSRSERSHAISMNFCSGSRNIISKSCARVSAPCQPLRRMTAPLLELSELFPFDCDGMPAISLMASRIACFSVCVWLWSSVSPMILISALFSPMLRSATMPACRIMFAVVSSGNSQFTAMRSDCTVCATESRLLESRSLSASSSGSTTSNAPSLAMFSGYSMMGMLPTVCGVASFSTLLSHPSTR